MNDVPPSPFRVISYLTQHSHDAVPPPTAGQCDCDCDCAIPPPSPPPDTLAGGLSSTEPWPHVPHQTWPDLYAAPLAAGDTCQAHPFSPGERYTLVFNPLGGVPAVLNEAACRLLDAFAPARSISQVIADHPDWSPAHVQRASAELAALSLLRPVGESIATTCHPPPDTLAVWLHVTNRCNLRCDYCYLRKTDDALTLDAGRRAVDAVFRSATRHRFRRVKLKYGGGEASLNAKVLIPLHDYASEQASRFDVGLDAVLLSNGVALGRRLIQTLRDRGIRVMISLDGIGAAHDAQRRFADGRGSFAAVSRTLDRLQAMGVTPHVSVTVSARNLDGLPDTVAYLLARDLPFGLYFYRDNECSEDRHGLRFDDEQAIRAMNRAFDVIEVDLPRRSLLGSLVDRASFAVPHQRACGVGQNYLVINQHGLVAKCQMEI